MAGSRSNVFKNNSVSVSMHGAPGLPSHLQITDDNSNSLSRAGLASRGIGIKKQQPLKGRESKAWPDAEASGRDVPTLGKKFELRQQVGSKKSLHKRSNTTAQNQYRTKQSRLPIGYRVQQEKRSELHSRTSNLMAVNSGTDNTPPQYEETEENLMSQYNSQLSQNQLRFNKVQRVRPMTGKA